MNLVALLLFNFPLPLSKLVASPGNAPGHQGYEPRAETSQLAIDDVVIPMTRSQTDPPAADRSWRPAPLGSDRVYHRIDSPEIGRDGRINFASLRPFGLPSVISQPLRGEGHSHLLSFDNWSRRQDLHLLSRASKARSSTPLPSPRLCEKCSAAARDATRHWSLFTQYLSLF